MTLIPEMAPEPGPTDGIYVFDSRALTRAELWRVSGGALRFLLLSWSRSSSTWPLERGQYWPLRYTMVRLEELPAIIQAAVVQWQSLGLRVICAWRSELLGAHELSGVILTDSAGRMTASCALHRGVDALGRIDEGLILAASAECEEGPTIITGNGREVFEKSPDCDRLYLGDASIRTIWERHTQRCASRSIPAREDRLLQASEFDHGRRQFKNWVQRGLLRRATAEETRVLSARAESCERCGSFLDHQRALERRFCQLCLERQTEQARALAQKQARRGQVILIVLLVLSPLLGLLGRLDLVILNGLVNGIVLFRGRARQSQGPRKALLVT